ncbi:rho GTPase-activating protein 23 isoform X2 [Paroedura picta]|uniref:rho GTPase-activating protein 23 isoform X2 n=1 Tax=Paroedura picta TaxID=143630 RepID=UPI00405655C2
MVEEGTSRADRAPRTGGPRRPPHAPAPPPHGISVVGKAVWSVARAGKGWRFERAVGVDCSLPEPRCIWLTSLQNDNAEWWERRWRRAGAVMARQKCRGLPRRDKNPMPKLGRRDGLATNANTPPVESFPWVGPKTVVLHKNLQGGYGFTLRHFIVYPPESAVHSNVKEEENGNRTGPPRGRLEPMDTIFVKSVKEDGPAYGAGLRTGDRLVKVNGESIIGKTYSQVIGLIQNCEDALELSIMPKDEDILQLAYSQDAYLKGNEPYSGGAQSIPEPPPICYPRKTYPFQSRPAPRDVSAAETNPGQQADNRQPYHAGSSGPSSPLNSTAAHRTVPTAWAGSTQNFSSNHSSPTHRTEEIQYGMTRKEPVTRPLPTSGSFSHYSNSSCPGSITSPLPERYYVPPTPSMPNHTCYGTPKRLPDHRPHGGLKDASHEGRSSRDCLGTGLKPVSRLECQQALSNWISNQVPRRSSSEERHCAMPPRYRSVSQDRLGDAPSSRGWPHSASQDTLIQTPVHDSWSYRARSDNYLVKYGQSLEALEQGALISPRYDRCMWPPDKFYRHGQINRAQPSHPGSYAPSASSRDSAPVHVQKHPSQPNLQSIEDSGYIGYRSYSPSFQRRTGLLHALSFRDATFGDLPTFNISQRQGNHSTPPYAERPMPAAVLSSAPAPCLEPPPGSSPEIPVDQRTAKQENDGRPFERASPPQVAERLQPQLEAEERRDEVVLRQKPPTGRKMPPPARQMNFVFPDDMKETDICDPPPPVPATGKENKRGVAPLATPEDSLASIPFIDEPTSPSIDLTAKHIPASSVVSSAMNSAPVLSASPSSPTFTFAVNRHYSQDCSNIKASRRSSYLLAITTERSKSCDDGLNTFRDEGKHLRRLPSRVPSLRMLRSFFTDGSLDSLGTSEDTRSKRHSTSDLSDVTFSDVRREGWLHYKQILTKKGKAEDRDDMLAWIKAIRESSKAEGEDPGFASQALINKKLNDYRKVSSAGTKPDSSPKGPRGQGAKPESQKQVGTRQDAITPREESVPQKAPWGINIMKKNKKSAPRAFGVRLEDCQPAPDNKKVPLIVEACCKVVEDKGLEYMGIYRVPGNNAVVSSLQEQLNKGFAEINLQDERWQDLNVISSLLKSFFRKLPEPLFTDGKYNDFIEANRIEDASERMKTLRKLIRDLPDYYYETLKFLVGHLKTIADHSEKNKMEPRNLALVFGPTLVRTSEDNMTDMVTHMPDRYKIVETLIQHSDWFFSEKEDKGETTPVDEQEAQSVPNIEYLLPNIRRTTVAPGDASDSTNGGTAKSKASWSSRKEHSHKEMLAISFISAVAHKRKKRREAKRFGSSTDDDSEHESAAKPSMKGTEEEEEEEEEEEAGGQEELREAERPQGSRGRVSTPDAQNGAAFPARLDAESEERKGAAPRGSPDARSIVSGYSTLSTIDHSVCSEVQSVAESRGEEADDERSEFSHVETDTENGFGPGQAGMPGQARGEVLGEGATPPSDKVAHSRASFSSHHLMQCDTLARRKLSRPYRNSESSSKSSTEVPGSSSPGSQESLQPTEAAEAHVRPSLAEQLRLRLRGSADDVPAVQMRKPHPPETRRKKNSWRRHTVVVPGGLKDLNYEWSDQHGLGGPGVFDSSSRDHLRDNKDSGLSSLESTKARPSSSAQGNVATSVQQGAAEPQHRKGGSEGRAAPRRTASLRFHQCL